MKTLKNTLLTPLAAGLMLVAFAAHGQTDAVYAWTNFVGQPGGPGNVDGTGSAARFHYPWGVAVDSAGNVFVADNGNHTLRKVTPAGEVTTLAGSAGSAGTNDGTGSAARFYWSLGMAVDSAGNVFVADFDNSTIRKVTPAGVVTTLPGSARKWGSADGTGSAARFCNPQGVAVDCAGNVFVADYLNFTIRQVSAAGVVTTLAGSAGEWGSEDGTGSTARFYLPSGMAVDSAGNVFVADSENHTIRQVSAVAEVTTLAGSAGNPGSADGTGSAARFYNPYGVAVDSAGNVFVGDTYNNRISKGTPLLWFDTSPAGLHRTPNGLQLTVTGLLGRGPVTIYVSTNLVGWDVLRTNPPVTGTLQVLDAGATNAARRFYRASEQR